MSEAKKEKEKKVTKKATSKKVKEEVKEEKIKNTKKETKPRKSTKKNEVLLNKKDQHRYSVLCKIVRILAKIGRVCLMIMVPFIFLFMIVIPFFFKKVEISSNIIKVEDMSIILHSDTVSFKIGDTIHSFNGNVEEINRVIDFLSTSSESKIVLSVEVFLLILGIMFVLEIYLLSYIEKLFLNFENEKVPFTEQNTQYLFKLCIMIVVIDVIGFCVSFADIFSFRFNTLGILGLLIIFVIYYLFKYATEMQKKSNTEIRE